MNRRFQTARFCYSISLLMWKPSTESTTTGYTGLFIFFCEISKRVVEIVSFACDWRITERERWMAFYIFLNESISVAREVKNRLILAHCPSILAHFLPGWTSWPSRISVHLLFRWTWQLFRLSHDRENTKSNVAAVQLVSTDKSVHNSVKRKKKKICLSLF